MDQPNKLTASGVLLTTLSLLAFAGNSILCRLALGAAAIDPASYTAVRLVSGALTLRLIGRFLGSCRPATAAGIAWGAYSLLGRGAGDPKQQRITFCGLCRWSWFWRWSSCRCSRPRPSV